MAAYLIVDVDDLLSHFRTRGIAIDLQELAVGLRGGAALAAGLMSADQLKAVAAASWTQHRQANPRFGADAEYVFKAAGYDTFDVTHRESLWEALHTQYFAYDPDPVNELIVASTSTDLIPLMQRIRKQRSARIRMWGSQDVLEGTPLAGKVIFQPLETLLGIQQTKNVAIYIDFENIAISLNEQGYIVNLDSLIESFQRQGKAHGTLAKIAAYAPWGQRGSLPPLVDLSGREVADDAPSRLMMANIDPVFNLPGKNSADMRIVRDILADSSHGDAADVYIIASGDRDFNDAIRSLRARNKQVILWSVQGSTSRQLTSNPNLTVEYVEHFTNLQTHQALSAVALAQYDDVGGSGFTPSQWSSVIIQFDSLLHRLESPTLTRKQVIERLVEVSAVVSTARGEDLVAQAISFGIVRQSGRGRYTLDGAHPVVDKTRLIRDRIVLRVVNTLSVRGWEYVNYGFLLKGLSMDRELERPGLNYSDQWRSDWIDCLVRERVLMRELVPHRHNPDDLVPVIKLSPEYELPLPQIAAGARDEEQNWEGIALRDLEQIEPDTAEMVRRIIISVEQFTSFRGFTWCPLGSLHKRLRGFDNGMSFQRAVEYLIENDAAEVKEYPNPQSDFFTKGISLHLEDGRITRMVINERDLFIRLLLGIYERGGVISDATIRAADTSVTWDMDLWFSIMETENVLNPVPGRGGQYSLFRTHHTVSLVADRAREA